MLPYLFMYSTYMYICICTVSMGLPVYLSFYTTWPTEFYRIYVSPVYIYRSASLSTLTIPTDLKTAAISIDVSIGLLVDLSFYTERLQPYLSMYLQV